METFYSGLPPTDDEKIVLQFLVDQMHRVSGQPRMLEVGCGPTIHHILPFAPHVSAIHMADYLTENLVEVQRWQQRELDAYDWRQYATLVADLRGGQLPALDAEALERLARARIQRLLRCDLKQPSILGAPATYPVVAAFYCTEEVGIARSRWEEVVGHLSRTVEPGGLLFLTCLRDTDFYLVGDTRYPCARITERDVRRLLPQLGFDMAESVVEGVSIETQHDTGLAGVVLAAARKRR
jgi:hypothetical protein